MTDRVIETEADRKLLYRFIAAQKKLPFTVTVTRGKKRSLAQNDLQHKWLTEITYQLPDDDYEGWRTYCKLHFGVPILRAENPEFKEAYDEVIRPLPYELKLKRIRQLDFPVSRRMTTKQFTKYLDDMHAHFTKQGVVLTDPEREEVAA